MSLLGKNRILPVVEIANASDAVALAEAFLEGGISVIEITLRTPQAWSAIDNILKKNLPITVGIGSIQNVAQLKQSQDSGAHFGVTPALSASLISASKLSDWPLVPGVATPGEALNAHEAGFHLLKLFPAVPVGGTAWLKAVAGPLPHLQFVPTGGITVDTASEFLALGNVVAVGGSWLAPKTLLADKNFKAIAALAKKASLL